jgi:hypothetical protein
MLLDDGFAVERFLGRERSSFRKTNLGSILLGFSNALADTAM